MAPGFVKFLFATSTGAIVAGAVDTAGAVAFLAFGHAYTIAMGAPGLTNTIFTAT
jgi:hypothetical protein